MMFPITDPSRADDIRMRRRRGLWLLAGIALLALLTSHRDHASPLAPLQGQHRLRHVPASYPALSATGATLSISLRCADSLVLVPQPDLSGPNLSGKVLVSEEHGHDPASLGLLLTSGSGIRLEGGCDAGQADIVVRAPPSMPLTLDQAGDATIRIGAFTGPLHLVTHGSTDAEIDQIGALDAELAGNGDLSVGQLSGDLRLRLAGSGDVSVSRIHSSQVSIAAAGSGNISLRSGRIDNLEATLAGENDLSVEAETGDARVRASEASDITMPRVTGQLVRSGLASGSSR